MIEPIFRFVFIHIHTKAEVEVFAPDIETALDELKDMVPDSSLWKLKR